MRSAQGEALEPAFQTDEPTWSTEQAMVFQSIGA
jgi:hypothetical protein